tara:strand:- start:6024 stop:7100 length:1077 start_codon:yes stop_codon:yes gene_type:complete
MIPIYKPYINGNEKKYILECIESSWISSKGKFIKKFEDSIIKFTNAKYASSCSNGTTALDLAFKALEIGEGDEVITSNFTYVASTNAILNNKATPVFTDIETDSWNINCELIENKINKNTKAILISNIYGFLPNIKKLKKICDKYKLYLIEDAAESLGSSFDGIMSGNIGYVSTLSFFGNKTITTGEGGMVLTSDKKIYEKIEILKNQGNSLKRKYFHEVLGFNYRMTNIQAAIGLAQMEQIYKILKLKTKIYNYYRCELGEDIIAQKSFHKSSSSYWIVTALFDHLDKKNEIVKVLEKNKIETRPLFYPIDKLPFYNESKECIKTYDLFDRGICLPSYPGLKRSEMDKIIELIKKIK